MSTSTPATFVPRQSDQGMTFSWMASTYKEAVGPPEKAWYELDLRLARASGDDVLRVRVESRRVVKTEHAAVERGVGHRRAQRRRRAGRQALVRVEDEHPPASSPPQRLVARGREVVAPREVEHASPELLGDAPRGVLAARVDDGCSTSSTAPSTEGEHPGAWPPRRGR